MVTSVNLLKKSPWYRYRAPMFATPPPLLAAPRGADTDRRRSSAASHGALQLGRLKGTYEPLLWLEGLGRARTFEHLRSVRLASIVCLVLVETGFVR